MKEQVDSTNIPNHIAVIMDGNGRWAKSRGARRIFGHQNAIKAVREISEGGAELGVKYLTLYAFSTENWARPKAEVMGLMQLLVTTIRGELDTLTKNNIRLHTIGDTSGLPSNCQRELSEAIAITEEMTGMVLTLALNYSGRSEILEATKAIAKNVAEGRFSPEAVTPEMFEEHLQTKGIPDPELLIRTSGEMRVSNYLLWQIAYTELFFTDVLWPDFRKGHLLEAIKSYQNRERRFGKISEQLKS
ncbi:MAG: isoprenyl transferase [Bacteroidota bacterium]